MLLRRKLGTFALSGDLSGSYIGHAVKPAAQSGTP
jgi:hypothetical protein